MTDIVNPVVDIISRLWLCCARHTNYLCNLQKNKNLLSTAMNELKEARDDVQMRVVQAEADLNEPKKRTEQVRGWLQRVQIIEGEVEVILRKADEQLLNRGRCLWGCCPPNNCWSIYKVGKSIAEKIPLVNELKGKGDFQHVTYSYRLPPPVVQDMNMEKFLHNMANEKPIRFTSQQLSSFTNNCSDELGSGGFGVVYQGEFPNGVKIAVKVLNRSTDKRVKEQFMAEVATIGRTYHVNLVRLYGFCFDNVMFALVYEFMENGSLDNILFKENPGIECDKLYEIAIGTAKGLAYLHEDCQHRIIHYDIKPGNVLLDVNLSPKVADFGLAKLCSRNNTHVSNSGYRGTPGYSAPEFLLHNYPITHKCDVYSFGMLLFEIVRKRRNSDVGPTDSLDWFPKRVWEEYDQKGGLVEITSIECKIEEKDREKAERMFMVALWCVQDSPQTRPSMSTVVRMLEGDVQIMPPSKPFQYLYSIGLANVPGMDSYSSTAGKTDESTWYSVAVTNVSGTTDSYCSTAGRTDESTWCKDSTPIMRKYEIHMASSSSSNL